MPPRKRLNNWRSNAILLTCIASVCVILFYVLLKFELVGPSSQKDSEKYGESRFYISKKSALQKSESQYGEYTQYVQFQDFQERKEKVTASSSECLGFKNCFNFNRCISGFYIYVYPIEEDSIISPVYSKILDSIKNSSYYTNNPKLACVFVLSLDTLDRDIISTNFIKNLDQKISRLEHWNDGENHLIFNLFFGTWPNYLHELSFNYGKAILVKSSYSQETIRQNYDISIPLIPKDFPLKRFIKSTSSYDKLQRKLEKNNDLFPVRRKYLLAFKGKRYLYGIGSETRNGLNMINNDEDIVLLTTCKHGKNWEKFKDERCDEDNIKYEKYDYKDLLINSTFCLIPRGRRLGSFRFLEAIQYSCIPVLLTNGWHLPYSEVLDWSKFSLSIDERLLLQIPSIIRSISDEEILAKRQQTLLVWKHYFSSIQKIVHTSLEVLRERIKPNIQHHKIMWNHPPGGLYLDSSFSASLNRYPFYGNYINSKPEKKFTAVILAVSSVYRSSSPLFHLIRIINQSPYLDQILVIWLPTTNIPSTKTWPKTKVTLRVIHPPKEKKTMNARYLDMGLINTDAVFTFDEDVLINISQIDFAFSVWYSNPAQLIGFTATSHYPDFNSDTPTWKHTTKQMNEFSMIRTSSSIFHKYYGHQYIHRSPKGLNELVEREKTCESMAMNFLISSITGASPIKVARSFDFKDGSYTKERLGVSFTLKEHFETEQQCFSELISIFNGMPLVHSKVSMNPILFKDPVSISRKKYKTLE